MSFYWIKTNSLIKKLFSHIYGTYQILKRKFTWHLMTYTRNYRMGSEHWNYTTPKLLFFVLKEYWSIPFYFRKINTEKASDRNHTFNHLNGWKTTAEDYSTNISLALLRLKVIQLKINPESKLFRPPYGKIKSIQAKKDWRVKGTKLLWMF
jgi:hypothetical protein